ncbi:MAG: hypothetical protein HY907_13875 [Deltaproteobacteria bacterium]|nr:hypothetical protein [Deltaproteobacteria bacterium]
MSRIGSIVVVLLPPLVLPAAVAGDDTPVSTGWTVDSGERVEVEAPPPAPSAAAPEPPGDAGDDGGGDDGFRFDLHGYYRARTHVVGNLMYVLDSDPDGRKETLEYVTQRLRLQPEIGYGEWVTLHVTVDALDNVVWGDNAGLSSTALFAGEPSQTGLEGSEMPFAYVRHAWLETNVKFGVLRVGRMPSNWGLGILSNDGEGFDEDFGDNWYGDTYDRILFATKPISIVRALMGEEPGDTPLILVASWDKLVEDFQKLDDRTGEPVNPRDGYDSGWLANGDDDVDEWTVAAVWHQEELDWLAPGDSLAAGVYYVYREQPSTSSEIHIFDAFLKLRLWDFFLEGELDAIRGSTKALALGPEDDPPGSELYMLRDADILGWLVRVGWQRGMFTVKLESGQASGDGDVLDANFSNMAVHPDVNVGLLLYEELLAQRTRDHFADKKGLWSNGGVYNSIFFMATGVVEPLEDLQFTLGILTAWADEACDVAFQGNLCSPDDPHPNIGIEIDASARYRFWDRRVLAVVEGGWLHPDDETLSLDSFGLAGTDMWTIQTRLAFAF